MIKNRKLHIITCLLMMITLLLLLLSQRDSEEIIKYFPLDDTIPFQTATTSLDLLKETGNDRYMIKWKAQSSLDKPVYLRQDISLLYMDGQLKGVKGLWKEQEKDIDLEVVFEESDSSHFQAISYHHGESHYPNDEIKSIQRMSSDHLYVIDSPYTALEAFRKPDNDIQNEWKETIDKTTTQQLHYIWNSWLQTANLNADQYHLFPLVEIIQFQDKPIESLTQAETNRIVGQLWEGLYKNYVQPIANQSKTHKQMMPLILIDKDLDHLIVLFNNVENEVETLYQKLSVQ